MRVRFLANGRERERVPNTQSTYEQRSGLWPDVAIWYLTSDTRASSA